MNTAARILFISSLALIVSCGTKPKGNDLADKKAQLASLKKQQAGLNDQVTKLEADIAKIDPAAQNDQKTKLVTVSTLQPGTFTHYIDLQGKIEALNISYITPRGNGGQVKALFIKKGDNVTKGQLILQLDDAVTRQMVVTAKTGIESIKTQLAFAQDLYNRQNNLWKQGIGTEVQLITDKNNVETLNNQLKSAQEQLKINEQQLGFTSVYSDVSGVADDVNIRVGELFMGSGQIRIVNTSNLKATAMVPENYSNKVSVGSHVSISLPDINRTIDASITVASKLIDPNSRSFYVEARIPSDKDFRPNQLAVIRLRDYVADHAITVPLNTMQTDEKGKYVMVAVNENGKLIARKRQVVIGELYGDNLEIKSGLNSGDTVITDGFQGLYEGQLLTTK